MLQTVMQCANEYSSITWRSGCSLDIMWCSVLGNCVFLNIKRELAHISCCLSRTDFSSNPVYTGM